MVEEKQLNTSYPLTSTCASLHTQNKHKFFFPNKQECQKKTTSQTPWEELMGWT